MSEENVPEAHTNEGDNDPVDVETMFTFSDRSDRPRVTPQFLFKYWETVDNSVGITPFYSHNPRFKYHQFSNFSDNGFNFKIPYGLKKGDTVTVLCSEQAIMLCKASLMNDEVTYTKLIYCKTPQLCKRLGREVRDFDQELWDNHICKIAKKIIISKFLSSEELIKLLLSTRNTLIVEAAPNDCIWGIGLHIKNTNINDPTKWRGSNVLGWSLMEAREYFMNMSLGTYWRYR